MKKFFGILVIFSVILLLIFYTLCHDNNTITKSDYLDAIIDKHELLKNTKSPRIILCGGSNIAFGIDSKIISDSIGLPVINMGLQAGLGLKFIINEVKGEIRKSDIIIFSIEHFLGADGNYNIKKEATRNFPKGINYFNPNIFNDIKNIRTEKNQDNLQTNISNTFNSQKKIIVNNDSISVYYRKTFNNYGDVIGHLDKKIQHNKVLSDGGKFEYSEWDGIKMLNDFAEYAKFKNIKVYFIFPNYPKSEFEINKGVIKKYENDLRRELKMPILNKPEDFVFADSLFYDTVFHLNKVGREKRTGLLIEILKRNHIGK